MAVAVRMVATLQAAQGMAAIVALKAQRVRNPVGLVGLEWLATVAAVRPVSPGLAGAVLGALQDAVAHLAGRPAAAVVVVPEASLVPTTL